MEPTRVPIRGFAPRLLFLTLTLALTFAGIIFFNSICGPSFVCLFFYLATVLLSAAIMSDHWEEVEWNKEILGHSNRSLAWYLNGRVAVFDDFSIHRNRRPSFLIPMHGGIWTMCVALTGNCDVIFLFFKIVIILHVTFFCL